MDIAIEKEPQKITVKITGSIDVRDKDYLARVFKDIVSADEQFIVLDMNHVPDISSIGFAKLLVLRKHLLAQGRHLSINKIHSSLRSFFATINADRCFEITPQ